NDGGEITALECRVARSTGKERVAGEQHRCTFEGEGDAARRVPRGVDRAKFQLTHRVHRVVFEQMIVTGQHASILTAHPDVDPAGATAHDVHIVFDRTHHEAVHLGRRVGPDELYVVHSTRMPPSRRGLRQLVARRSATGT